MKSARTRTHLRHFASKQDRYTDRGELLGTAGVTIWDNSASERNLLKVPWLRSPAIVDWGGAESPAGVCCASSNRSGQNLGVPASLTAKGATIVWLCCGDSLSHPLRAVQSASKQTTSQCSKGETFPFPV
jgi:hypothetical protein